MRPNKLTFWVVLTLATILIAYLARERYAEKIDIKLVEVLPTRYSAGDLYSVHDKDAFTVVKILVDDPDVVHLRLYKNKFAQRPVHVDPQQLTLGSINDPDGFGIGHLPLSKSEFASWQPQFIAHSTVTPEELEGYKMWKESNGGIFGH